MPVAMTDETASLAARTVGKSASIVRTLGGIGSEPDGDFGDDAEHPLAADEQAHEIGPPGLAVGRAELDDRAVGQHDLELARCGWW